MGWGQDFYEKQLGYFANNDIDGLMRDHYHDDAELVSFEFVLKGKEAIRKYLAEDEPARAGTTLGMTLDHFAEGDDVIIFSATIKTELLGAFIARDALYVKDGKIYRHIALTLSPENDKKGLKAL